MAQTNHRERLLDGAIRCLQQQGYARTTARDIARAADANLASIGYHFGSKEALLNEALMRSFARWTEEIVRRTLSQSDASPVARMLTSWQVTLASFEECKPLLVAFVELMAEAQHSDDLRVQVAQAYQQIRRTVAGAVQEELGENAAGREANAEVIASFLIAICDGLMLQWLLDPDQTPTAAQLTESLGAALTLALS